MGLGVNGITALVAWVWAKAIGRAEKAPKAIEALDEARSGDIEALVEAVEPSLKKAHRAIGPTAQQILIINGNNNNVVVGFDQKSRSYLEKDHDGGISTQDVSVASLNVNSRYGRVYFLDLGRTVPFKIDRDAHGRTLTELSKALDNYAKKTGATVNIRFRRIEAEDGRLKRIMIYDAWHLDDAA